MVDRLRRKIQHDHLVDKGFPGDCDNCGFRPTPESVVRHGGDCEVCGGTITADTVDVAEMILKLKNHPALPAGIASAMDADIAGRLKDVERNVARLVSDVLQESRKEALETELKLMASVISEAQQHVDDPETWGRTEVERENYFTCVSFAVSCWLYRRTVAGGMEGVESTVILEEMTAPGEKSVEFWADRLRKLVDELGGWA